MAERVAGLDVGSNSFLLVILDKAPNGEEVVLDRTDIVGLGDGVDQTGRLAPAAVERALNVLEEYAAVCRRHRVRRAHAVGTSALRDAANRDDFVAAVRERTGFEVEVISGDREAELTYRDVSATHGQPGEPLALLDIGGGSSEIVQGRSGVIASSRSIDLGSRRLTERAAFVHDPPGADELDRCRALADAELTGLSPAKGEVVGTGGTITTLVAVDLGMTDYDAAEVSANRLGRRELAALLARLAAVPLSERAQIAGMEPKRAPVMIAGAILLERWMEHLGVTSIAVSAGGMRYAVAREAWEELQR
ncbi:MAG: hypothetical protein HYU66_06125 [Armatimonadetes bacterium]|nr:hypothetical protein [Armatimonadota bacterium]